jgi:hypothetical protein
MYLIQGSVIALKQYITVYQILGACKLKLAVYVHTLLPLQTWLFIPVNFMKTRMSRQAVWCRSLRGTHQSNNLQLI